MKYSISTALFFLTNTAIYAKYFIPIDTKTRECIHGQYFNLPLLNKIYEDGIKMYKWVTDPNIPRISV